MRGHDASYRMRLVSIRVKLGTQVSLYAESNLIMFHGLINPPPAPQLPEKRSLRVLRTVKTWNSPGKHGKHVFLFPTKKICHFRTFDVEIVVECQVSKFSSTMVNK